MNPVPTPFYSDKRILFGTIEEKVKIWSEKRWME